MIQDETGINIYQDNDKEKLLARMQEKNIRLEDVDVTKVGWGTLVDSLYKKECRPKIISPMFLLPSTGTVTLARANDDNPQITDRFQLVVSGMEIVNAYSELVDPVDQRDRLMAQQQLREAGDEEAMEWDEDYVRCMEYGMPPNSGWGMGIDRFVALITNEENIKNTVYFPLMRPQS